MYRGNGIAAGCHAEYAPTMRSPTKHKSGGRAAFCFLLYWALMFLVIAIIAAVFGFGGMAVGAVIRGWRGKSRAGSNPHLLVLFLVVSNELRHLRIRPHGLYQNDVPRIEEHPIRPVHFVAAPYQDALHLFRLLIDLTLDVIYVGQLWKCAASIRQLSEVDLIVIEENSGVRGYDLRPLLFVPFTSHSRNQYRQHKDRRDNLLQNALLPAMFVIIASYLITGSWEVRVSESAPATGAN